MAIIHFTDKGFQWPQPVTNSPWPNGSTKGIGGGFQVTFNHDLRKLGKGDCGGPWWLENTRYNYNFGWIKTVGYEGPTLPWENNSFGIPFIGSVKSDQSYNSEGAKAIAATEPTASVFNGSQAIGEAVFSADHGVPAPSELLMWKDKASRYKDLSKGGDDYLSYQFGWVPLVSDIRDFAYSVSNASDIVDNYRQHANVGIKRTLELSHNISTQTEIAEPLIQTYGLKNVGRALTHYWSTLDERKWFVGKYTYYMPVDNSTYSRLKRYKAWRWWTNVWNQCILSRT
jgi:hypothetical protein